MSKFKVMVKFKKPVEKPAFGVKNAQISEKPASFAYFTPIAAKRPKW